MPSKPTAGEREERERLDEIAARISEIATRIVNGGVEAGDEASYVAHDLRMVAVSLRAPVPQPAPDARDRRSAIALARLMSLIAQVYGEELEGAPPFIREAMRYAFDVMAGNQVLSLPAPENTPREAEIVARYAAPVEPFDLEGWRREYEEKLHDYATAVHTLAMGDHVSARVASDTTLTALDAHIETLIAALSGAHVETRGEP